MRRLPGDARSLRPRELAEGVIEGFREHGLLVEASAIAFRIFLATLTAALCILGFLGFLGLEELYTRELEPPLRDAVSQPAFRLVDGAVTNVLRDQQVFWMTAGAVLALWEISAVLRATGQTLNRIYETDDSRSLPRELATTMAASAAVALLLLGAVAAVRLGAVFIDSLLGESPPVEAIGFAVRWGVATVLLLGAVAIVVRVGPDVERPLRWVTFGSLLVVCGWIGMSVLFSLYLTEVASYSSVFGNLATVFLAAEYLFLAAVIFLGGLLVDALVEERS